MSTHSSGTFGVYVAGRHPKTKKALREAIVGGEQDIVFEPTSPFQRPDWIKVSDIEDGSTGTVYVVGPDPFTDRRWYAQVALSKTGKVVVK